MNKKYHLKLRKKNLQHNVNVSQVIKIENVHA